MFPGLDIDNSGDLESEGHDYKVFRKGKVFVVKSQLDDTIAHKNADAGLAIQKAIDLLTGGGEVCLQRGRYLINAPLNLTNNVTLCGKGRATVLEITEENKAGIVIQAQGIKGAIVSDIALHGKYFDNAIAGLVLDDCGDCTVSDLYAKSFSGYGIWLRNNSFLCEIKSCKLADNQKAGILLDTLANKGRVGDYIPNLVNNCLVYGGGTGIECKRALVVNIVGCVVYQPQKYGFHLHSVSNSVLLSGCRTFQCYSHAVLVEDSLELNISSNVFCWQQGNGILLKNVYWGLLSGNEVIDSGTRGVGGQTAIGIEMRDQVQGVQVTANTIFNWGGQGILTHGVREDDTCRNNGITNNNLNFIEKEVILSKGTNTLVADNTFQKDPAYRGNPKQAYPRFDSERLVEFIKG